MRCAPAPTRRAGRIGLLTPGTFSETYFEHATLARYLDFCWSRATISRQRRHAFISYRRRLEAARRLAAPGSIPIRSIASNSRLLALGCPA